MMLGKTIARFLLLLAMALAGGCLGRPEPTVTPTTANVDLPTPASTAIGGDDGTSTPRPTATDTPALLPAPIPGHLAPDFTLPDLAGNELRLSDLKGQVVLVNFWATWCPNCRRELPALNTVYQELKNQGLVVVAVDIQESLSHVAAFVEEHQLSFPIVLDSDGSVAQQYRVQGVPTSFVVDREGVIQETHVGAKDADTIRRLVEDLL
ncbi:MAG: peroxiredoxin family protein [Anaerolineae bacterium]